MFIEYFLRLLAVLWDVRVFSFYIRAINRAIWLVAVRKIYAGEKYPRPDQ